MYFIATAEAGEYLTFEMQFLQSSTLFHASQVCTMLYRL
jgi:hypothetical protein